MKYVRMMAVLFAALTLIVSCSDDDDENNGENTENQEISAADNLKAEQHDALISVLSHLTGEEFFDSLDVDFEDRTFEPIYGEALDASNPFVRTLYIVKGTSGETYFRSLVGSSSSVIKETINGLTIDLTNLDCRSDGRKQSLGTLTFHRPVDSSNAGTVDVNIPCIPHLRSIVYKTLGQIGENSFVSPCAEGEVYISEGVYWICTRISMGTKMPGYLVHVGKARGELYKDRFDGEIWEPKHIGHEDRIYEFLALCASEDFLSEKKKIRDKLPGLVFPYVTTYTSSDYYKWSLTKDNGFATSKADYSHWSEYRSISKAAIIRDCTEGSYNWKKVRWPRRCHYVEIPAKCIGDEGASYKTFSYYSNDKNSWYKFRQEHYIYTINVVQFTDKVPSGFELVDI